MKKNNLLKVLTISFLIFVVLCWIIPVGSFSNGSYSKGAVSPVGLYNLINNPMVAIGAYISYGLLVLAIGGFYGVLSKAGVYDRLVEKYAKKYEGKENKFLVITIVLFTLLSSVTGATYALLILVPLFIGILTYMKYDKLTMLLATIGSILMGNLASTYGFEVVGYINHYLGMNNMHNVIAAKVILLVVVTVLLSLFAIKNSKRNDDKKVAVKETKKSAKTEKVVSEKPVKKATKKTATKKADTKKTAKKTTAKKTTKKKTTKKGTKAMAKAEKVIKVKNEKMVSLVPFMIIFGLFMIGLFVACYNWRYSFNVGLFEDIYEAVIGVKVKALGDLAIFAGLLGSVNPFGYWSIAEITVALVYATLVIGWVYSVKFGDMVEAFINGAKKLLPAAVYLTLAFVITSVLVNAQSDGNIYNTFVNWTLGLTKGFNIFTVGLVSFVGGFFLNDMPYLVSSIASPLTTKITDSTLYPLVGLVMQTMHGLAMFVLPTSAILIGGLAALEVPYKDWIKYIWKLLLQVFVVAIVICFTVALFI